jgi:hypothetical protein
MRFLVGSTPLVGFAPETYGIVGFLSTRSSYEPIFPAYGTPVLQRVPPVIDTIEHGDVPFESRILDLP